MGLLIKMISLLVERHRFRDSNVFREPLALHLFLSVVLNSPYLKRVLYSWAQPQSPLSRRRRTFVLLIGGAVFGFVLLVNYGLVHREMPFQVLVSKQLSFAIPPQTRIALPATHMIQNGVKNDIARIMSHPCAIVVTDTVGTARRIGRSDSFCLDQRVFLSHASDGSTAIDLGCGDPPPVDDQTLFPSYMYQTGPGIVMRSLVRFRADRLQFESDLYCTSGGLSTSAKYTILVKREGAGNLWHSLMEIFSFYLVMDTLSLKSKSRLHTVGDTHFRTHHDG